MILPKTGHFFFNFKHQLLHIFQWVGQNQDISYDQLEEESHDIYLVFFLSLLYICQSVSLQAVYKFSQGYSGSNQSIVIRLTD